MKIKDGKKTRILTTMGKKLETQIGGEYLLWSNFTDFLVRWSWTNLYLKWPNDSSGTQQTGALDQGTPLKRKLSCRESPDPELWANPGPHEVLNSLFSLSFQTALPTQQHGHQAKETSKNQKSQFQIPSLSLWASKGKLYWRGGGEERSLLLYASDLWTNYNKQVLLLKYKYIHGRKQQAKQTIAFPLRGCFWGAHERSLKRDPREHGLDLPCPSL